MEDVAIGVVCNSNVTADFAESLAKVYHYHSMVAQPIFERSGPLIAHARNRIVARFLDHPAAQYLLMIDSDIRFTPEDCARLRIAATEGRGIIQGLYFRDAHGLVGEARRWDHSLERFQHVGPEFYGSGGIKRVDVVGAGFLLVSREAFERIGTGSWFYDASGNEEWWEGDYRVLPDGFGEDGGFSINVAAAEMESVGPFVHCDVKVGHVRTVVF